MDQNVCLTKDMRQRFLEGQAVFAFVLINPVQDLNFVVCISDTILPEGCVDGWTVRSHRIQVYKREHKRKKDE